MSLFACHHCGKMFPIDALDGKPERFAGPNQHQIRDLVIAADTGENFTRLECSTCYGPGYISFETSVRTDQ